MSSLEEESNNNSETDFVKISETTEKKKVYRTRSCSERSDSGISDCSNHALTSGSCSCTSTPLLGKRFSINEEPEYKKIADGTDVVGIVEEKQMKRMEEAKRRLSDKVKRFSEDGMTTGMLFMGFFWGGNQEGKRLAALSAVFIAGMRVITNAVWFFVNTNSRLSVLTY